MKSLILAIGPLANNANIFHRQLRSRMQRRVRTQRHRAPLYLRTTLIQQLAPPLSVVTSPLRKIQMTAAVVNVVYYKPRNRRHVRVPRPARLV